MGCQYISFVRVYRLLLLLLLCLGPWVARAQTAPFKRGINLTGWFQADGPRQIQFTRYTRQDFEQIKSLGCDVIRLPINLHAMTGGAPDYVLDPLFLQFLDEPVRWATELNLHLILDNHTFDPAVNTSPAVGAVLEKVWKQLAQHYRNHPGKLYYEVLNEPHGISDAAWNTIQQQVVQVIRTVDTKHTIIVGGAGWNGYNNLNAMPVYTDKNLIYTFHFYDPFLFTHQGATWGEPSLAGLAQMPFPYRAGGMPAFPQSLRGTWVEGAFNNYSREGTVARVKELIDVAANFQTTRGVPVFCGEFGVYQPNSPAADRVFWYDVVRQYLEEKNIAWTMWDYHGGFGLFQPNGSDLFHHDLNVPLLQALNLTVPPQTPYVSEPARTGFMIYSDFLGTGIFNSSYGGMLDFYAAQQPNNGAYCLAWSGASQYNSVVFDFKPNRDLSELAKSGYGLSLLYRATTPGVKLDVRFIDTKTSDPQDHPWRGVYTLDQTRVTADGRWQKLFIPLTSFADQGSWDHNAWYPPAGKFDWSAIDRLEVTSEHGPMNGARVWLDNICLTNLDTARVRNQTVVSNPVTGVAETAPALGLRLYPNPTAGRLLVESRQPQRVTFVFLDHLGRTVSRGEGSGTFEINTSNLAAGSYLLRLTRTDGRYTVQRVVKW